MAGRAVGTLLGLEEVATLAGMSVPAVTQWRKKKGSDFPPPLAGDQTLVFDKGEVEVWLSKKKKFKPVNLEATLWAAADKMRGHMDAAEYKHVVLGLVFLNISDAIEARHRELLALEKSEGADPEDPDEYRAEHVFWVPPEARWQELRAAAKQPEIGRLIDEANGRHRAGESVAQGCAAEGLRSPGRRQASSQGADRPHLRDWSGGEGGPLSRPIGTRLRVLPGSIPVHPACRGPPPWPHGGAAVSPAPGRRDGPSVRAGGRETCPHGCASRSSR